MAGNFGEPYPSNPYPKERKGLELNKYIKYFLHGLGFTVIMFVITIGWVFILIPLAICGLCFGIVIALGILVYVMGWVNTWLMGVIWGKEKTSNEWWGPLVHGALLFVVLLVLSLPWYSVKSVIPELNTWPYLIISILVFLVYCFIDGIAGYYVGTMFTETFVRREPPMEPMETISPMPPEGPQGPSPPSP